jgi:putative membrane protein
VVVLLVRYVGNGRRTEPPASRPSDPRNVLAERFARGEIDEEEYRSRLHVLTNR